MNGCQSEVFFVKKFKIDCQCFVIIYDIEIIIMYSLFIARPCFTRKATPLPWPVEIISDSVITWDFEIVLFAKEHLKQ